MMINALLIIILPDAIPNPGTMMIKFLNTGIAFFAMRHSRRPEYMACRTEFDFEFNSANKMEFAFIKNQNIIQLIYIQSH